MCGDDSVESTILKTKESSNRTWKVFLFLLHALDNFVSLYILIVAILSSSWILEMLAEYKRNAYMLLDQFSFSVCESSYADLC